MWSSCSLGSLADRLHVDAASDQARVVLVVDALEGHQLRAIDAYVKVVVALHPVDSQEHDVFARREVDLHVEVLSTSRA